MTGTDSQIEWAELIRPRVEAEFDRVAKAFRETAASDTAAVIEILEEKRREVMAHTAAGYFIKEWRELGDQVRRLIAGDPRFQAIKDARLARRS